MKYLVGGGASWFPCGQKEKNCFLPYVRSSGSFVLQNEQRLQLQACHKFAANRGVGVCFPVLRLCVDVEGISTHTYLIAKECIYFRCTWGRSWSQQSGNNCTVEARYQLRVLLDHHPSLLESGVWVGLVVQTCAGILGVQQKQSRTNLDSWWRHV